MTLDEEREKFCWGVYGSDGLYAVFTLDEKDDANRIAKYLRSDFPEFRPFRVRKLRIEVVRE